MAYAYTALALLAAVGFVVGSVILAREANQPCPDDELCESFAIIGAYLYGFLAVASLVAAGLVALVGHGLRRGSRVSMWTTVVVGGPLVLLAGLAGLAATVSSNPGLGLPLVLVATLAAVPVGLVVPDLVGADRR